MANASQKIFDKSLRRQIQTGRFAANVANDTIKILREAEKEITARLTGGQLTEFGRKRFQNMLTSIQKINLDAYNAIGKTIVGDLRPFVNDELNFQAKSIQTSFDIEMIVDTPATSQVMATVLAKPFEGEILKDWVKTIGKASTNKIARAVKIGFIDGDTIGQVVSRLKGVYKTNRRGLEAIVRTATTHTASIAREATYAANNKIVKGVKWVSTLDGNTTPICQNLDGKIFKVNKGPRPPAHVGCRSSTVPAIKSWKELGFADLKETDNLSKRPFVADKRKVSDIPKSERDNLVGQVPADETYPTWLKRQPAKFQDEVLGRTRGKLFRKGEVTLNKFSDRTGRLYTLDKLRKREKLALEDISL